MSTSGFRFSRIIASVFWSWIRPRIDRYSHCTGTITLFAAVSALMVNSPSDGVVVAEDRAQCALERPLAADLRGHRDLGAGEVDRRAGDVDLAAADDVPD